MRRLTLVVFAVGLGACHAAEPVAPDLPDSLFVDALVDIHLADARASATGESAESLRTAALARHGLDTTAFGDAMRYYAAHPDTYLPLYDQALDRLLHEQRRGQAADTL